MARGLRKQLIRFYSHAQNDLDRVLTNFKKIHDEYVIAEEQFGKSYAIQTTQLEQLTKLVMQLKDLLEKFRWESM